ncbi:hypothetical protein [Proteus terrae]|uniref:hypothetical protein n=1 Tax=Proteus terrae TaxID=1574161 RepID=UPI0018E722F5|nr:hypothetical protein [Proteus terrae]MBJ2109366.1 hypothetical protein [Proteus terrae]MBJ2133310.1 hypothetical protein [Proteus terrae]
MKKGYWITLFLLTLFSILIFGILKDIKNTKERGYAYTEYNIFSYYLNTSSVIKSVPRISNDYFFTGDGIIDRGFRDGSVTFCLINDWNKAYQQLREYTDKLDFPVYYGNPKVRNSEQYLEVYKYDNCLHITYSENYF